jgi:MFS transporter, DHA1 family, multidrug resistance protein
MQKSSTVIIWILGALMTVNPISIDMYLSAFPQIAAHFHTTVPRVALSLSSYFVGLAVGQLVYGPFLDRFGRKRPLYFGLVLYLLSTVLCLLSPTIRSFVISRGLQAFGACAAQVGAVAMVNDFYPTEKRSRTFSYLMLILSVSPLFAPSVGSVITTLYGWKAVFMVLFAAVFATSLLVCFFLPEGHEPDPSISLDVRSITGEFVAILRNSHFLVYALSGALSFSSLFAYLAAASALFMGVFQLDAKGFGLVFAGLSIGMIGGGQVSIFLNRWFSSELIYKWALYMQIMFALVFFLMTRSGWFGFYPHVGVLFFFISCIGLTYPNSVSIALMPFHKNTGSAAALLGFLQMGVGALVSASFGYLPFQPNVSMAVLFLFTGLIGFGVFNLTPRRASAGE